MTVLRPGQAPGLEVESREALDVEAFVVAQGSALVRLARALLRDPHAAEDVVQDVLARVVVKWAVVQRADDPVAYVKRMVVNACVSSGRRAWRRERPDDPATLPDRGVVDHSGHVGDRDQVLALLRTLPVKQRSVLVLRHYEGLADAEIADLLGCSQGTVRSNAFRGLAALRALLGEEGRGGR
ncbi:SigE family RNA polymerase sigma factor [Kineococcus sp. NUM-3379]